MHSNCSFNSLDVHKNPLMLYGIPAVAGVAFILGGAFGHQFALIGVGGALEALTLGLLAHRVYHLYRNHRKQKEVLNAPLLVHLTFH